MSDYLASLFARYQPETPVITPRVPSLFEPEQAVIGRGQAWVRGMQEQEPVVQESEGGREIPLSPPFAKGEAGQHAVSQYRGKIKPPSFVKGGVGGGFSSRAVDTEPPHNTVRSIVPNKPIPAAPVASSVPVQPIAAPLVIMPRTLEPSAVQIKDAPSAGLDDTLKPTAKPKYRQQDNPPETQPPLARPVIPNSPAVTPAPVVLSQPLAAAKPAVNTYPTQLPVVLSAARIEPKILPTERNGIMTAPAIPAFNPPESPPPQPEPVINVTIGRIEIRATVAVSKQKPQAASRPPVMGLDEYLRQRGGKS